ncbi:ral GTPase-activating protein subunit beta-like isoform X2 [Styela clava]
MYSEWTSVKTEVQDLEKCTSVLHHYLPSVGRDVAKSVVTSLLGGGGSSNGSRTPDIGNIPRFRQDSEVKWTMEVVCFGLSLTLMELDTLRESVNVYLDWLTVLTVPKATVPEPILKNPLSYVRQMIYHLQNLFIPRTDGAVSTQVSLCQNVLRTIQNVVQNSMLLDRETWETILMFMLNVCDKLLAAPSQPNGLAEQLCELLMQTFMQVWLLSCARSFPSPPLWKTARLLFAGWRHHPPVVEYWCKITAALTARVVEVTHGPSYPKLKIPDEDLKYLPNDLSNEVMTQTWYRMLHMINNPVDLSNANLISKYQGFFETAFTRDNLQEPAQHPSLAMLPTIFLRALRGISTHVDAFLGISGQKRSEITYPNVLTKISNPETPTIMRKAGKSASRKQGPSTSSLQSKSSSSNVSHKYNTSPGNVSQSPGAASSSVDMHPRPAKDRPHVNSVLNLYGQWLFDAALAGVKLESLQNTRERGGSLTMRSRSSSGVLSSQVTVGTASSSTIGGLGTSQDGINLAANPLFDSSEYPDSYDAGRSEAFGTLCRIFSCKKTGEHILPVYLSRFYLTMSHGLMEESNQVLASILLNSVNLFRIDLPGITCLLPGVLNALESILPDRELTHFKPYVNVTELRRAAIHLLLSMIPLPLHYDNLPIEDIQLLWSRGTEGEDTSSTVSTSTHQTFRSLKLRIIHQLIGALQCETDPVNAQMILGGMLLALQDSALVESIGHESAQNGGKDGIVQPSENENVAADTAYGFFVNCIYLVSQRLESWKSELSVSLAALELLAGLAKAKIHIVDSGECRRAVRELCRYIVNQCERPPPHHKRELHSMIVAAFHTLTTWLLEHPYLLNDKDCLNEVLEIIELGISGSKSSPGRRGSSGTFGLSSTTGGLLVNGSNEDNKPIFKGDKDLNPASMRVLEAAEGALVCVFEHLGAFPSPCSPSSTCCLLNELSLVRHACGHTPQSSNQSNSGVNDTPLEETQSKSNVTDTPPNESQLDFSDAVKNFRYFVIRNTVLLGVLEQNLGNEQEPVPTVTLVLRSASGRKVHAMQFRQTPRSDKQSSTSYLTCPARPSPDENPGVHHNVRHRTFPEEVDRIPLVKADCSIPMLSEIPDKEQAERVKKIQELVEQQKLYDLNVEKRIQQALNEADDDDPLSLRMKECFPPDPAREFQTARLLLSHLNLMSLSTVKHHAHQRLGPDLVMLNRMDPDFPSDIEDLDSIPVRNNDTVFIFYHKAGQTDKQQILENTSLRTSELRPEFSEFVLSLGWPVDLRKHPGWTGNVSTSWKLKQFSDVEEATIDLNTESPGIFNGDKYILYHADVLTETAFIIPTRQPVTFSPMTFDSVTEVDGDASDRKSIMREKLQLDLASIHSSSSASNESPSSPTGAQQHPPGGARVKKISTVSRTNLQQLPDCRVAVVWTESYEGIDEFPLEDLLSEMYTGQETTGMVGPSRKDMLAIFIHPLENGLFSINVNGQTNTKSGMAVPLVSGIVVSRRALGAAVRMTASNMCHRRRLDSDAYSPPHIKRKHRINELLARYQRRCTEPDFFTAVFAEQHAHKPTLPGRIINLSQRQGSPVNPLPSSGKRPLSVA